MKSRNWQLVMFALAACGCAAPRVPSGSQLPECRYPCRIIDCGNARQIPITVIGKDAYLVGETPTNSIGVSNVILGATQDWKYPVPVSIRAGPETRLADIWAVLAAAAANCSHTRLLVHKPGVQEPQHIDIAVPSQLQPTNAVTITYTAGRTRLNGRDLTEKQLRTTLTKLATFDHRIPVLFVMGSEMPYNQLISGLSECQAVGLSQLSVRLLPE